MANSTIHNKVTHNQQWVSQHAFQNKQCN
jgi:hypothetical protein